MLVCIISNRSSPFPFPKDRQGSGHMFVTLASHQSSLIISEDVGGHSNISQCRIMSSISLQSHEHKMALLKVTRHLH